MDRRNFVKGGAVLALAAPFIIRPAKAYFTAPSGEVIVDNIDPSGQVECTQQVQDALNYAFDTWGGGIVKPYRPGSYRTKTLYVKGSTILQGYGQRNTYFGAPDLDINAVIIPAGAAYAGLRDLTVQGCMLPNPVNSNAVTVDNNVPALIQNCHIWGGNSALYTKGVDGVYENCFISGWKFAAIVSNGANWYKRVKADTTGSASQNVDYGFYQGIALSPPGIGVRENTFDMCDFSGAGQQVYNVASVYINDGNGSTAQSVFNGSVFSGPIRLINHFSTLFSAGCRFGNDVFAVNGAQASRASVVGCHKYGTQLALPAGVIRSGNINII